MYMKISIPEVSSGGAKDTDDDENNHTVLDQHTHHYIADH
jgi:hypothetical protein